MADAKKVLIFGAAGRVGQGLTRALLRHPIDLSVVDLMEQKQLEERTARAMVDTRLAYGTQENQVHVYGGIDVLDEKKVADLLIKERPDIVVNYAIPFTWDAAKQLPNYARISHAGLGAFAAAQVLAPKMLAQALAASGIEAKLIVGNLPDITVPVLYGLGTLQPLTRPVAGAGNVGLIEAALQHQIAKEHGVWISDLTISLVAHHVHWVAPREPGYRNDAPFLLQVDHQGENLTPELGDLRELMNRSIVGCYEAGAGFSSTTALLAARLVLCLLDEEGEAHSLHVPAPNGRPGGYPVTVRDGTVHIELPPAWQESEAIDLMKQGHQRDGIKTIEEDGSIHFDPRSVAILKEEIGFELPSVLRPSDLEMVAKEQIRVAQLAIGKS